MASDLSELASLHLNVGQGVDLAFVGPATGALRTNVTHAEERTRPFVGSVFWQAFLESEGWERLLKHVRRTSPRMQVRLLQVVAHQPPGSWEGRYDLMVLADDLSARDQYRVLEPDVAVDELRVGSARFLDVVEAKRTAPGLTQAFEHSEVAVEAASVQPFGILLVPAPRMVPMANSIVRVRDVSEPVTSKNSTAGVQATNREGASGVTAALHAVSDSVRGSVTVDGVPGTVASGDMLSDSAFVVVPLAHPHGAPARPLTGLVPRLHEPVTFEGHASGRGRGNVTGWSPQLPYPSPRAQLVVTTGPITAPGDSGAALYDANGVILGFCQEASPFGVVNPFSTWIWAESVFLAHGLS